MTFSKTGVVPVKEIKCSCGHDIKGHITSCPNCGKTLVPAKLQTTKQDTPADATKENQKLNN